MAKITKTLTGRYQVNYTCPKCGEDLINPIEEAGGRDTCPECSTAFLVPGKDEANAIQAKSVVSRARTLPSETNLPDSGWNLRRSKRAT